MTSTNRNRNALIINTSKKDVIWNYIGTIVSMTSSFILLPILLFYLTEEEIGLWYIYLAITQLTNLFEFGFNPTFARNIVYCLSGLSCEGGGVGITRLAGLMKACKVVYGILAVASLLIVGIAGTIYIGYVAKDLDPLWVWSSWCVIVVSIVINLYYLYALTYLRGFGDIEGENKAKVASRVTQIVSTAVFLIMGWGLLSAALGLLLNGVVMRSFALTRLKRRQPVYLEIQHKNTSVTKRDLEEIVGDIWHIAWRDGVVQLSSFASGQAMSIVCSLFLGLSEAGIFSICSQFSGAVIQFANVFVKSYYPAFQAAFARGERERMRDILDRGLSVYYVGTLVGTVGVLFILLPLLPLFKPGYEMDASFFLAMTLYNFLGSQYSIFCNLIVNTNRVPYVWSYLFSAVLALVLCCIFPQWFSMGMWGILIGQFIAQAIYNFWKWPKFMLDELGTTLTECLHRGFSYWGGRIRGAFCR